MSPKVKRPGSTLSVNPEKNRAFQQRARERSRLGKPKDGESPTSSGLSSEKRGDAPTRRESLAESTRRKAREALARGEEVRPSLRPFRKRTRSRAESEASEAWHAEVTAAGCAMEGPHYGRVEGHHVIPKQALKREGHGDKLWDVRNGVGLCSLHHANHEGHVPGGRLPRTLLPSSAFDFAAELGLTWLLDREYPDQADPVENPPTPTHRGPPR